MSNKKNHNRGEGKNAKRSDHGPTYEGGPPSSGCNSTHVARSRSKWHKRGHRAERRTGKRGASNVMYETGGGQQPPSIADWDDVDPDETEIEGRDFQDMTQGFVVLDKCCDQCLFSKDRIVSGERAVNVIEGCKETQTHFQCHKGSIAGVDVCCRGWYDRFPGSTLGMRYSDALSITKFVTLEDVERFGNDEIDYDTLIGETD